MSKALTLELIHMKTKTNRIESIKNLNLWGNDLDDIGIVASMNSLEVLSLSVNNITTLRDVQGCHNLRELYLRKNNITDINEVRYLQSLRKLRIVWLGENPIADIPRYRQFVIKCLPQIEKLDNDMVTGEDKQKADLIDLDDFEGMQPQQKISPPRHQPQQQKQMPPQRSQTYQPQYDNDEDDDYDKQHQQKPKPNYGKVQRSPPQQKRNVVQDQYSSPKNNRNISPQENFIAGGGIGGAAKIRHSPKREQVYEQPVHQPRAQWGAGGVSSNDDEIVQPQRRGYVQQQQQPQYQRAQTAQVDYDRNDRGLGGGMNEHSPINQNRRQNQDKDYSNRDDDRALKGQLQPHQIKERKNGTREQFRNENILCAIIALMKELDKSGLEFVKKDCEKRIAKLE